MTDEQAFLAAIAAAPDDEAPRKIFADWLDEKGRYEEADYQRRWTPHVSKLEQLLRKAQEKIDALEDQISDPCGC